MSHGAFERIKSPAEALAQSLDAAKEGGLRVESRSVGRKLITTTCEVIGPGSRRAIGRGKGIGQQSAASAVFEAFEHYYHKYENKAVKLSTNSLSFQGCDKNLIAQVLIFRLFLEKLPRH